MGVFQLVKVRYWDIKHDQLYLLCIYNVIYTMLVAYLHSIIQAFMYVLRIGISLIIRNKSFIVNGASESLRILY